VSEDVIIIIVCAGERTAARGAHNKFLSPSCWCAHTAYLMMKFCLKPLVIYKLSAGLMLVLIRSYQLHALRSLAARPPPYRAPRVSPQSQQSLYLPPKGVLFVFVNPISAVLFASK